MTDPIGEEISYTTIRNRRRAYPVCKCDVYEQLKANSNDYMCGECGFTLSDAEAEFLVDAGQYEAVYNTRNANHVLFRCG